MTEAAKKSAYRYGRLAEQFSCLKLRLTGYTILQRGFQAAGGEIEIIARRGNILAFIEVKARKSMDEAAHALGPAQRRRIERTALAYLARNNNLTDLDPRFDLIMLSPRRWPRHQAGAWVLGQ